jgi:hypothetical protein
LRFLLDNDVAVTVRRILLDAGHECWTAAEANLHDAPDDALAVYAADRGAALVSHDAEFARRRRQNTIDNTSGSAASNPAPRPYSTNTSPRSWTFSAACRTWSSRYVPNASSSRHRDGSDPRSGCAASGRTTR